ncbi:hypothetical protein ACHAPT_004164 [Fusarium lateritium]
MEEVYKHVTQYLRQIYNHISTKIPELIKGNLSFTSKLRRKTWESLDINFIFSTPATWQAPVSHRFREIVSKAGFGEQKLHKVMLGLTEAEAAAVFTCQSETAGKVRKGDVVLSIDAGGGTTDVAFVKATANTANSLTLEEIEPVGGVGVGATRIDSEFAKLIQDRINEHPEARSVLPRDFSLKASQSFGFQTWKHSLGSMDWDQSPDDYLIRAPGVEDSYSNQVVGIKRGRLYFTRQELESCFDKTLQDIKGRIKEALGNFEVKNRIEGTARQVDYIVLSGGLGSSEYVLKELDTYFKGLADEKNSCVAGSKVLRAAGDPRMAVVSGLLCNRRTSTKAPALGELIARANYGIVVEEPQPRGFVPTENIKRYPANTTVFATDQIRWLVKFGETIEVGKPITLDMTKRLEKSDQRTWTEKIVWLSGESPVLPENVQDGLLNHAMKELHKVDIQVHRGTKLSPGARTWYGSTAYHKCYFKLTLAVGPSGDCVVEVSENVIKRSE